MPVTGDLSQIRAKIRRLTSRPSPLQLPDADLDNYINAFYVYDLPEHLRVLNLKTDYTLTLVPNQDTYPLNPTTHPTTLDTNLTFQPPAYVAGYSIQYYQDKQTFYQFYPNIQNLQTLATGNGLAGPYNATISARPIIPNTVFISTVNAAGVAVTCTDTGTGLLTGDVQPPTPVINRINYQTGVVTGLFWLTPIAAGTPIYVQSVNYQAARPNAVLFYNNAFVFRPIPDKGYQFTITSFIIPTTLLAANDVPELIEMWELIAYGAALKIVSDNLDMDAYQKIYALFDKQMCLVERRTLKQLSTQRANTIYSQYDQYPFAGSYPYM